MRLINDKWPIHVKNKYMKDDNNVTFPKWFFDDLRDKHKYVIMNTKVPNLYQVVPKDGTQLIWNFVIFPNDLGWSTIGYRINGHETFMLNQIYNVYRGKWSYFKSHSDPLWKCNLKTGKEYYRNSNKEWEECEFTMTKYDPQVWEMLDY